MRESIGGSWVFTIIMLFIVLMSAFMWYSVNYTRAFKVKNEIINFIEENEGFTYENSYDNHDEKKQSTNAKIKTLIDVLGYNKEGNPKNLCGVKGNDDKYYGKFQEGGYCVDRIDMKHDASGNPVDSIYTSYYKVTSFIKFTIPVINLSICLPVKGETKALYFENEKVATTIDKWK